MEDAHIHETNIDGKGTCIFGIFDGHGGNSINVISFIKDTIYQQKFTLIFFENHLIDLILNNF